MMTSRMGRLLEIWRSWSAPQQAALGAGVLLFVIGAAVGGYLILKRPSDVVNTGATFIPREKPSARTRPSTGRCMAQPRAHR